MMDLERYLYKQMLFSMRAFGPGHRVGGIIDHITKEFEEVRNAFAEGEPTLPEWIDVIILAFDGAWRSGATPEDICRALEHKLEVNQSRQWPDWRTADKGKAIEHIREEST